MEDVKILSGIDSLYYFIQSNHNYLKLYDDIQKQIEDTQAKFKKENIEFENSDINITIDNTSLNYRGKAEGFHWFRDLNNFYKVGFKKSGTNKMLQDIRVQLQGVGIYTVGIKNLLIMINDELLQNYSTTYYPVTRADLNCFVQYDFSFITRDMFVTRKRQYATISEIGSANTLQTIYIGKEPFKLRLYNKTLEMQKSQKEEMMKNYFTQNGFDINKTIFNVEFQLNRQHLRHFEIDSVDNLLCNAENVFKVSMDDIRLIQKDSISNKTAKSTNKNRAKTDEVWEHIKNEYSITEFLQNKQVLKRTKRKVSLYDDIKFHDEYRLLLKKAFIHSVDISNELLNKYYDEVNNIYSKSKKDTTVQKSYRDVEYYDKDNNKTNMRWLNNGELITPVQAISVNTLGDYALLDYVKETQKVSHVSQRHMDIYDIAKREAVKRGLPMDIKENNL